MGDGPATRWYAKPGMEGLKSDRKGNEVPQSAAATYFFFFAGCFFAAGVAAGSVSGIFDSVMIWIWLLTGAVGRAESSNCSSPRPTAWIRLAEILKVLTRVSRMASARRWLRIALASRLPLASI